MLMAAHSAREGRTQLQTNLLSFRFECHSSERRVRQLSCESRNRRALSCVSRTVLAKQTHNDLCERARELTTRITRQSN